MFADFSQQLSDFDSRSGLPPSAVCWCGVDAVALRWDGLLLLVGPYGDWLKRACEGPQMLVPEVDGLRCITGGSMSLLRRVPEPLLQVCIGVYRCVWVCGEGGCSEMYACVRACVCECATCLRV